MIVDDLGEAAAALDVRVDAGGWARLEGLIELWLRYGRAINLTAARTREALLGHVEDGLATLAVAERRRALGPQTRWLDVGSGAGMPALVVAACRPVEMMMVEPRERRAAFLTMAAAGVACGSAWVRRARVNTTTWGEKRDDGVEWPCGEQFDVLTSRAVFGPSEWLELGIRGLAKGGLIVAHGEVAAIPRGLGRVAVAAGRLGTVSAFECVA